MAQDSPAQDLMNYEALAQEALRGVVRMALKRAASPAGLPGDHHFYISFRTDAPGVSAPKDLLEKYPDEMTIVLRHRYRDLAPGETFFSVTLEFGGKPKSLEIPYSAITRFYDPAVQFLLPFEVRDDIELPTLQPGPPPKAEPEPSPAKPKPSAGEETKIISLDSFRKK